MTVLVAYASRHGSTRGIAERIADRLQHDGVDAVALPARTFATYRITRRSSSGVRRT